MSAEASVSEPPNSYYNANEYDAEYILIPGGRYKYHITGQTESIPDMYFARYPVTNRLYRRFVRYIKREEQELENLLPVGRFEDLLMSSVEGLAKYLGSSKSTMHWELCSHCSGDTRFGGDNHPVVGVTWFAAKAYCLWLTELGKAGTKSRANEPARVFRLPKEVEWVWAASGGERIYPWGDGKPNETLANYANNIGATTPVGSYPAGATPEGLMDMAGNVWEWMEDWHVKYKGIARSIRGGGWHNVDEINLRCAEHYCEAPYQWAQDCIGFRVVFS